MVVGLVLSSAGARGDFEVGAVRFLYERLGVRPQVIAGTSVGAINAVKLAEGPADAPRRLQEIWLSRMRSNSNMYLEEQWFKDLSDKEKRLLKQAVVGGMSGMLGLLGQPVLFLRTITQISATKDDIDQVINSATTARSLYNLQPIRALLNDPNLLNPTLVVESGIRLRLATVSLESGRTRYVNERGQFLGPGRVGIFAFNAQPPPAVRYKEDWGQHALLNGWQDPEDLQLVGDFVGLGHDQVLYVNRSGAGGKVMIVDYAGRSIPGQVLYWEDWGQNPLLNGWLDDGDLQLVGDFLGLGHDQVLYVNRGGAGGKVMVVDYAGRSIPGQVLYEEHGGDSPTLDGWLDYGDQHFAGSFTGGTHHELMLANPTAPPVPGLQQGALASASSPVAFPPVEIDGEAYVDGGSREILPIQAAIEAGADTIYAVSSSLLEVHSESSFAGRGLLEIALRSVAVSTDEIAHNKAAPPGADRPAQVTVIAPRIQVHDTLTIDPALTRISIAYGYMRAADATSSPPPALNRLASITDRIIELRQEAARVELQLRSTALSGGAAVVGKLRDLKRQIAALAKERQALGGAVPDDVATWWRAWEQPSSPLPTAPSYLPVPWDLIGKLMIVQPSSPWAEVKAQPTILLQWSTVVAAEPPP